MPRQTEYPNRLDPADEKLARDICEYLFKIAQMVLTLALFQYVSEKNGTWYFTAIKIILSLAAIQYASFAIYVMLEEWWQKRERKPSLFLIFFLLLPPALFGAALSTFSRNAAETINSILH